MGHRLRRRSARSRCAAKLAKALGGWPERTFGDALEIGSGTGYFSLNLLQLGADRAADRDRHLAGDAASARRHRRAPRARGRDGGDRGRGAALRGRELRPRLRPRRPPPHPRPRPAPSPNSAGCCGPAATIAFAGEPSRYGDRLAALPKRGRPAGGAGLAAADRRRGAPVGRGRAVRRPRARGRGRRPRLRPRRPAPLLRDAGFEERHVGGEELLANAWGWGLRTVESSAEPDSVPWRLAQLRLPQLHRPAEGRRRAARAATSRPSSSTTSS